MNRSPFPTRSRGTECTEQREPLCFLVKPTAIKFAFEGNDEAELTVRVHYQSEWADTD
jgi:hypothetical protein